MKPHSRLGLRCCPTLLSTRPSGCLGRAGAPPRKMGPEGQQACQGQSPQHKPGPHQHLTQPPFLKGPADRRGSAQTSGLFPGPQGHGGAASPSCGPERMTPERGPQVQRAEGAGAGGDTGEGALKLMGLKAWVSLSPKVTGQLLWSQGPFEVWGRCSSAHARLSAGELS